MDAVVDHKLAAELAEIKRVLRRKERKLKKYNQVLGAKKHVRETLRRHNGASDSQNNSSSDPEKNITEEVEIKSSGSRTVTFSNDSPKVIFVSPTPYLESKRKDKNHKHYRSLSSRRSNSQDRKKFEKESCAKDDQAGVPSTEANHENEFPNRNNDKQFEKTPIVSDLTNNNDSPKICNTSFGSSSIGAFSEINTLKNNGDKLSLPKQVALVSGDKGTVQNKLSICEVTESKVSGKECSDGLSEFPHYNETHYPSNSHSEPEVTSFKNFSQAQDSRQPLHHSTPNDKSINWFENESCLPKPSPEKNDNTSSITHILFENVSQNCTNSVISRKDNQELQVERMLSFKDSSSQNEVGSQDLFETQLHTRSENIEIKRSCASHRKWWKNHRTTQSSSEGSGSVTSDKGEPSKRLTGIIDQNCVSQVSINEPLTKIDMQEDHNTRMHQTEELMIKEIEQEMMKEFISEISEKEVSTNCEISKEIAEGKERIKMNRKSNFHTSEVIHKVRHKDEVQNKLIRVLDESENLNKCKFLNNCIDDLNKGSIQKTVPDELFEDNIDVFVHEASCLENSEQQNRHSNTAKECDALKEKGRLKVIPQEHCNKENLPVGNVIAQKNCLENVVRSNKDRDILCVNEANVHSEYTYQDETFINDTKHEPHNFINKENVRLHTLSVSEKYGRILTSSLVTLPDGNENKINILTVHECGFILWSASRKGRWLRARSESHPVDLQSSFGKPASSRVGLQEIWEELSEVSHQVGRASDIRNIVAVGLPSDDETRYLVAITTTTEADLRLLCILFSPSDKSLVIESGLGLSFCTSKNLFACALGEWCIAIYWNTIEPSSSACFLVVDLDVTFSKRNKQWALQCCSSLRSQILDRPLDCLVALNQPDPKGVVLCTAGNILYIYDAIENTILQQIKWEAIPPSWTLASQELVFLISMDIDGGKMHLTVLNPVSGIQETFTETFPDDLRLHESNTEDASLKPCGTVRLTCACFQAYGLVLVLDNGVVVHVPFDAFKCKMEPVKMEDVQYR
nr:uncharacterized protein LOC123768510 isoform X2 [Procambarus clarkii]